MPTLFGAFLLKGKPALMASMHPVVLKKPADILFLGARTLFALFSDGQPALQGLHSSVLWPFVHPLLRLLLPLLF